MPWSKKSYICYASVAEELLSKIQQYLFFYREIKMLTLHGSSNKKIILINIIALSALYVGSINAIENKYVLLGIGANFPTCNSSFTSDSSVIEYSPTIPGTSLFQLPDLKWQNKYRPGINLNLAFGKYWNNFYRADIEFLYQNFKRKIDGNYDWLEVNHNTGERFSENVNNPLTKTNSRLRTYSLLLNGYYSFNNIKNIIPVLGAGFGVTVVSSRGTVTANTLTVDDPTIPLYTVTPMLQYSPSIHRTVFAAQIKAGFDYYWNKTTILTLQYRLFATSKLRAGTSKMVSNPGISDQSTFYINSHSISGLVTNSIELLIRFDL